jgi:lipoprotein-releasing system permease protein
LFNPMMITRGDRIAGVMVKGIDPVLSRQVLDLYSYMDSGSTEGLRRPNETPPAGHVEDPTVRGDRTLDDYLRRAREEVRTLRERGPDRSPFDDPPVHDIRPLDTPTDDRPTPARIRGGESSANADPLLPSGATPTYDNPAADPMADPLAEVGREVIAQQEQAASRRSDQLPGAIVGVTLARNLRLRVGDTVRIISPLTGADAAVVRHGAAPRARDFRIIGIFNAGLRRVRLAPGLRRSLAGAALLRARATRSPASRSRCATILDRPLPIGRRIERVPRRRRRTTRVDWESLNHNLFTALALQKLALAIVITIIIVIAAFNVIATLVMVVLDKQARDRDPQGHGAPTSPILQIFLLQGTHHWRSSGLGSGC